MLEPKGTGSSPSMDEYCRQLSAIKPLTLEESRLLYTRMQAGDQSARTRLIEGVLRFVVKIAAPFANKRYTLDEMVAEGNLQAILALDKWDPAKGSLVAFLDPVIKNSLIAHLVHSCHDGIRVPRTAVRLLKAGHASAITAAANRAATISPLIPAGDRREIEIAAPPDSEPTAACRGDLLLALRSLPAIERKAIRYKFLRGYTFRKTARKLRLTVPDCRLLIDTAVAKLIATHRCRFCDQPFVKSKNRKGYCSQRCYRLSDKWRRRKRAI